MQENANEANPSPVSESRRGFVTSVLGVGFALSVQPICAQTALSTPATGLHTGTLHTSGAAGDVAFYYAKPASGANLPTVLVVSEIFGVHEYIADVCRRLAKQGYLAIAPDFFARYGDPQKVTDMPTLFTTIISKVPDHEVMADLDAAAAWASKNGGDPARLAITGFCWGGRITWLYNAHNPAVKAGVAWYGRLKADATPLTPTHPLNVVDKLHGPVLGLYGGQDQGIPLTDVAAMNAALKAAKAPISASYIHVYPDAPHAFHADYRPSYRKEAAEDGWNRMLAWFKANGV